MEKIRVRFAPSPTGYLHIGSARTALFNWLFAKKYNGRFILRIEDTDEVRSTKESIMGIIESLIWLGIDWDEGPLFDGEKFISKGDYGPYFQMQRLKIYQEYANKLLDEGYAYECYCTPQDLDNMRRIALSEKLPPKYDGRCRNLTKQQKENFETQGRTKVLRFKVPDTEKTIVQDLIRGEVEFENNLIEDFIIMKANGIPTYQFACVIDDYLMDITYVIRGDDHLSNTPRQILIYKSLNLTPPQFAHLSMILGPDRTRLSKRHGATSVLEYKKSGFLPETVVNYLALLGWSTEDSQQIFQLNELVEKFSIERCVKHPAVFDLQKLIWLNQQYIRKKTPTQLIQLSKEFLDKLVTDDFSKLTRAVELEKEKIKLLTDIPKLIDFLNDNYIYEPNSVQKNLHKGGVKEVLKKIKQHLLNLPDFSSKKIEELFRNFAKENNLKTADVFHPVRVAVSGRDYGPGLFEMLELIGKDKVIQRIERTLKEVYNE